jgi:hypothetical protein
MTNPEPPASVRPVSAAAGGALDGGSSEVAAGCAEARLEDIRAMSPVETKVASLRTCMWNPF